MSVSTPKEGSERKTFTNWSVFEKANLIPVRIKCDGYLGHHPADMSCHSNILNTAESVQHHMKQEHGGGWFHVRMKVADGKEAKGRGYLAQFAGCRGRDHAFLLPPLPV